jgi:hypothetical protein
MRRRAAFALVAGVVIAAGAAAIFLTTASAGPPPTANDSWAAHPRPVAGRLFTGLIVNGYLTGPVITSVSCDARIGNQRLRARQQRFYSGRYSGGLAAITCTWRIPTTAGGGRLRLEQSSAAVYADGTQLPITMPGWQIRG